MADLFTPAQPPAQQRNWMPIVMGLIAVLVVIAIIIALTRRHAPAGPQTNPYAAKLQLSNPKLSAAENYVGGTAPEGRLGAGSSDASRPPQTNHTHRIDIFLRLDPCGVVLLMGQDLTNPR